MRNLIGATVRAKNSTHGLTPTQPYGVKETVTEMDVFSGTVWTSEGNGYLNGDYLVIRTAS